VETKRERERERVRLPSWTYNAREFFSLSLYLSISISLSRSDIATRHSVLYLPTDIHSWLVNITPPPPFPLPLTVGVVTRKGVALTDLQSLVDCQQTPLSLSFLSFSLTLLPSHHPSLCLSVSASLVPKTVLTPSPSPHAQLDASPFFACHAYHPHMSFSPPHACTRVPSWHHLDLSHEPLARMYICYIIIYYIYTKVARARVPTTSNKNDNVLLAYC
jgi:hypothetical protein